LDDVHECFHVGWGMCYELSVSSSEGAEKDTWFGGVGWVCDCPDVFASWCGGVVTTYSPWPWCDAVETALDLVELFLGDLVRHGVLSAEVVNTVGDKEGMAEGSDTSEDGVNGTFAGVFGSFIKCFVEDFLEGVIRGFSF
jgi:hypothetical protein